MNATGRDRKDEKIQYSTFLTIAGEDALEIYNTFTFEEAEANKVKPLIKKFEAYCNPRENVTYERHKFNTRCQEPDEKIDSHYTPFNHRDRAKRNDIHSVEQQHESDGSEGLFVGTISTERQQSEWRITLDIEQRSISLKIDTGAHCNVMPEKIYRTISKAQPSKAGSKLVSYSGHTIKVVGKAVLLVTYKGKYYPIEFQITNQDMDSPPVLGLATCLEFSSTCLHIDLEQTRRKHVTQSCQQTSDIDRFSGSDNYRQNRRNNGYV
ncbi:hypothetical protein QZH41_017539 [Actinostola sp. cb2023]|nr:hypothetical protein QZH41_017539 [Actinostola sp. cb2023]